MAYDGRVLRRARERLEADREAHRALLEARRQDAFRREPRLREVEASLRSTAGKVLSAALRKGTDPLPALEGLREENLRMQEEKKSILARLGLPDTWLEETPFCSRCGDSGYLSGGLCPQCLRKYYAQEQQKDLSRMLDVGSQSFDTFRLDLYPDDRSREQMEWVYQECRNYARNFGKQGGNLVLCGAPGLGKTFLSAAIAREVSAAGFSVVYDTAGRVFDRFESRKFTRSEDAAEDADRVLVCDLLILDDLGTEMTTAFVQSALYEIVNTRLMERRSTVLNTNLHPGKEFPLRYSPQIASRIEGEYRILPFFGRDIRKLKNR